MFLPTSPTTDTKCFIHHHGILHNILSEQCIHAWGINWFYDKFHHLESASPIESASGRHHPKRLEVCFIGHRIHSEFKTTTPSSHTQIQYAPGKGEVGVTSLTVTPHGPLTEFELCLYGAISPQGAMLPPGDTPIAIVLLNWKMRLTSWTFLTPLILNRKKKKLIHWLEWLILITKNQVNAMQWR